jgi:hypothetical protein
MDLRKGAGGGQGLPVGVEVGLLTARVGISPRAGAEERVSWPDDGSMNVGSFDAAGKGARNIWGRDTAALAVHATIPPILNGVVATVTEAASDLSPTPAYLIYHAFDNKAFIGRNGFAVQGGLEVLVEAFPTLLRRAVVHMFRDADPVARALFTNKLQEQLIFVKDPRSTAASRSHVRRGKVEFEENCRGTSRQEQAGDNYICTQGDGSKNVQLQRQFEKNTADTVYGMV